jgi:hypothetical protein
VCCGGKKERKEGALSKTDQRERVGGFWRKKEIREGVMDKTSIFFLST